jgi:CO/xanthine dehydrogenase Mo-binding subunit
MPSSASNASVSQGQLDGRRTLARVDGASKVTGRALYAGDVRLPGMLWGAVLRSPHPHARITRIDASAARQLPGVHAVLTGEDVAGVRYGRSISDIPILAHERVRFVGEPVAAVAAEDSAIAQAALGEIQVEYDELPAVLDPDEATAPGAPLLHPDHRTYRGANQDLPDIPNLLSYQVIRHGDPDAGFGQADLVLEHTYESPMQHQGYLEPQTCVVFVEGDGVTRIWASNKSPFVLRDRLARDLGLQAERIVVEPTYIGGDFGGKGGPMQVPLAYFLSRTAGRPVRMVLQGVEDFIAANPRHPARTTIRTGVKRDGRIVARHIRMVFSSGAYGGNKPIPGTILSPAHYVHGMYRIPNSLFESLVVYTNHVPCGHMRAPGGLQGAFACEVDVDRAAEAIGMDPVEFRVRNAVVDGDPGPEGVPLTHARLRECLETVRSLSAWAQPLPNNVGRGVAVAVLRTGEGRSSARVQVDRDGSVTVVTSNTEQGSGSHTLMVQVVARELQLDPSRVRLLVLPTDSGLWDRGGAAASQTHGVGQAVLGAARGVLGKLAAVAAIPLECAVNEVELVDGFFKMRGDDGPGLTFAEVARLACRDEEPVTASHRFDAQEHLSVSSYTAQVAEVELDRETGEVRVRRITSASDAGTILNEQGASGQIEGGLIMGLGAALMEEVQLDDGRVATVGLHDYKLPTSADIPPFEHVFLRGGGDGQGPGPYGARAVSELSHLPVAAAIVNAIHAAAGVRLETMPITAERVYDALRAARITDEGGVK